MKATEQYFPVVLFVMLYKAVIASCPVETLKCDHSNKSPLAVLSAVLFLFLCSNRMKFEIVF